MYLAPLAKSVVISLREPPNQVTGGYFGRFAPIGSDRLKTGSVNEGFRTARLPWRSTVKYGDPDLELIEFRRMGDAQALARLAMEPSDACGLIVLYQKHRVDLRDAVIQYMRVDPRIYRRAIINVLLGVAKRAHEYDPGAMDASQWIRCAAASEACRLRRALEDRR